MSEEQPKAKQDQTDIIPNIFRAITRPAVTIIFAAVIAQVVTQGIDPPQWFIALASTAILWWFGDRTVQHIKDKSSSPSKGED
jgi:threonine/homoserine/homoserine lactone efflux protein